MRVVCKYWEHEKHRNDVLKRLNEALLDGQSEHIISILLTDEHESFKMVYSNVPLNLAKGLAAVSGKSCYNCIAFTE